MSPSTSTPQDVFKRPGWWTCHICVPKIKGRGGMDTLHEHYMREHYVAPKAKR